MLAACAIAALPAFAADSVRFRPAPKPLAGAQANQVEGRQALADFRAAGIRGTYWLQFELQVLPRRGEERSLKGQLYGTRSAEGPLTRLALAADPGRRGPSARWLIQSGPAPAAWAWTAGEATLVRSLAGADVLQPVAGTDLTLFDLQMPFLYWEDFVYEGLGKVRNRPAHSFLLYPPADLAAAHPELTGVRVALDTQFGALVQAEWLGPKGDPIKTFTVLDVKKVGEQWLVKSLDLRNHVTRDKTRLTVNAAAFDFTPATDAFRPEGLLTEPAGPDAASVLRL